MNGKIGFPDDWNDMPEVDRLIAAVHPPFEAAGAHEDAVERLLAEVTATVVVNEVSR